MNEITDLRKQLTCLSYDPNQSFRKNLNWNVWALTDKNIQIKKGGFFRDIERIIWRTF